MDFSTIHSTYLIGIKGAGMTALAQVLAGRGVRVSGSDTNQLFYTDNVLRRAGIPFVEGFAAANIPVTVDCIIRSTAYGEDHVEVAEARRRGARVLTYPEAVAEVFNGAGMGVAVCGTHGKSTTTAMLGWVLAEAGLDPTVIVGAEVPQFGGNARVGSPDLVVMEADEYQNKFRFLRPRGVILTSIEYDHPDFFPTPDAYLEAFRAFIRTLPTDGFLVACGDDPAVRVVAGAATCEVIWYGLSDHSPIRTNIGRDALEGTTLQLVGNHNAQNALGVLAAAERLGVARDVALRAIASFQGTKRRFDVIGEVGGITVIDDYGHHPTEIRVTLEAARERYAGRRILCAFHAHTFTRTIALKDQFAAAFVDADRTYVMDIFGSTRERQGGITPLDLAGAIAAYSPATASGNVAQTVEVLLRDVRPGDVVICMGAGENDRVARGLVERLRRQ